MSIPAPVEPSVRNVIFNDSVEFLNEWNALKKNKDKIYISYDSTNKNCQAGDIELVEYGHAKEDKGLLVFNYSIAYDCNNREPLFYDGVLIFCSSKKYRHPVPSVPVRTLER